MGIKKLPLGKLLLFALLSGADLLLTWRLVQHSAGQVYESNPLANWWLRHYGWLGLAVYKGLAVGLVLALWAIVVRSRPRVGRWMLTFACSAVAVVVLYSSLLAGYLQVRPNEPKPDELRQVLRQSHWLDDQVNQYRRYTLLSNRLRHEVIARRCTLSDAACELAASEKAQNRFWLDQLRRRFGGSSDEECLAASFLQETAANLSKDPALAAEVLPRLEADFVAAYGRPSPSGDDSWLKVRLVRTQDKGL